MPKNYYVNEGDHIGGQEAQALGTAQSRIKASATITKGQILEITGNWTVGPASDKSGKVVGIAFGDYAVGDEVVIEAEGFIKLDATAVAITAGDKIVSGGGGKAKTYVSANDAGATILGKAFNSCEASGVVYTKLVLAD